MVCMTFSPIVLLSNLMIGAIVYDISFNIFGFIVIQ